MQHNSFDFYSVSVKFLPAFNSLYSYTCISVTQQSFASSHSTVWYSLPSALCDGLSLEHVRATAETYLFNQWWKPSGAVVAFLRCWRHLEMLWLTYLLTYL